MPLSEHEQRLLDQLEQQLHADDPKFASSLSLAPGRSFSTRNVVIGVLVMITGLLVLLGGVALQLIILGILGFLIMGGGVYIATSKSKRGVPAAGGSAPGAGNQAKQKSGFMSGLEEKWEERRREQ